MQIVVPQSSNKYGMDPLVRTAIPLTPMRKFVFHEGPG